MFGEIVFTDRPAPVDDFRLSVVTHYLQRHSDRVSVAFRRTLRRPGIPSFRFHDLRHTASPERNGMPTFTSWPDACATKDLRMAARYQRLSSSFLAQ
jgi:integrase